MTSPLSGIAPTKRRQLAATLGLFSVLFIAVGAVAATGPATAVVRGFVVVALVVAVVLALMAWGVVHSVRADASEQRLDAVITEAVRAQGGDLCGCGHEHDPSELHVTDACAHDGAGTDCAHSCDTCMLARLRPDPVRPWADAAAASSRPAPRPSPRPRHVEGEGANGGVTIGRAAAAAGRPSPAPRHAASPRPS